MDEIINMFKAQHNKAANYIAKVEAILDTNQEHISQNAQPLRLILSSLKGILKVHLKSEDDFLYKRLIENQDTETSSTAGNFWNEMRSLSPTVINFLDQWSTIGLIEKDPLGFKTESNKIFQALKRRIHAEETELYPLYNSRMHV